MNLVRLDLTKYNQEKLSQIEEIKGIRRGLLVKLKSDGVADVWIDPSHLYQINDVVAFTTKENRGRIVYMLEEYLLAQEEYLPEKRIKKFDFDKILEKINTGGMDSLTKSEKEYLIEYSKSL
jgi:hypothetical protein